MNARCLLCPILFLGLIDPVRAQRPQVPGQKYAFLVAASEYNDNFLRPLAFARNDIDQFATVLKNSGFHRDHVIVLHEKKERRFQPERQKIVRELTNVLKRLRAQDTLVLAFAGHGVQFKGDDHSYFCPVDADLRNRKTLISLGEIYKQLEGCPARHKLLLVDACRNNPLTKQATARGVGDEVASKTKPQKLPIPKGIAAFFSCSANEESFEHAELRHGVFFHAVIEAWKGKASPKGKVTFLDLVKFVSNTTQNYAHKELQTTQRPEVKGTFNDWVLTDIANGLFHQGLAKLEMFEHSNALALFSKALATNPDHVPSRARRARVRFYLCDFEGSLRDLDRASRYDPDNLDLLCQRACLHAYMRQRGKAQTDLRRAARIDSDHPHYHRARGEIHLYRSEYRKALKAFRTALARNPDYLDAKLDEALALLELENNEVALVVLESVLQQEPNNGLALLMKCRVARKRQKYDEAHEFEDRILSLYPLCAQAWEQKAMTFSAQKKNAAAVRAFRRGIELEPRWSTCYALLSNVQRFEEEFDSARKNIDKAIELDPFVSWFRSERGHLFWSQDKNDKAFRDYEKAIQLDASNAEAYDGRASLLYYADKSKQALADSNKAIQLDKTQAEFYYTRGLIHYDLGDYKKGHADLDSAIRLDPKAAHFHAERGSHLYDEKKYDEALKSCNRAIELDAEFDGAYNIRGLIFWSTNRSVKAVLDFTRAIKLDPKNPVYLENRAGVFEDLGKTTFANADKKKAKQLRSMK